ncbi:MAG: hypothetical protein WC783_04445 [Candidatus Paceibacterota bacterium]|jgi:hypothetical protein
MLDKFKELIKGFDYTYLFNEVSEEFDMTKGNPEEFLKQIFINNGFSDDFDLDNKLLNNTIAADNTYNYVWLFPTDINFRAYKENDSIILEVTIGGVDYYKEVINTANPLFEVGELIHGTLFLSISFVDGSSISFVSQNDSDVAYFDDPAVNQDTIKQMNISGDIDEVGSSDAQDFLDTIKATYHIPSMELDDDLYDLLDI